MNKTSVVTALLLCIFVLNAQAECESLNNQIPLSQIESIFQQMSTKSKWDVSSELLWGYFFFDEDKEKLQNLSSQLKAEKYREVELFFNGRNYTLHLERPEVHTPQTLYQRNLYLADIAHKNCVKTYDGFDVGR